MVLGSNVPPTVIRRRDLGFKSHPKVWRCAGSNSRPLVYNASSLNHGGLNVMMITSYWYMSLEPCHDAVYYYYMYEETTALLCMIYDLFSQRAI